MLMSSYHLSCQLAELLQVDMPYLSGMCIVSLRAKLEVEVEEEEEDTPAFRLPCSVGCCPRTVSIGSMFFLHLLLNVALDRRPA